MEENNNQNVQNETSEPKKSKAGLLLGIIVILIATGAGIGSLFYFNGENKNNNNQESTKETTEAVTKESNIKDSTSKTKYEIKETDAKFELSQGDTATGEVGNIVKYPQFVGTDTWVTSLNNLIKEKAENFNYLYADWLVPEDGNSCMKIKDLKNNKIYETIGYAILNFKLVESEKYITVTEYITYDVCMSGMFNIGNSYTFDKTTGKQITKDDFASKYDINKLKKELIDYIKQNPDKLLEEETIDVSELVEIISKDDFKILYDKDNNISFYATFEYNFMDLGAFTYKNNKWEPNSALFDEQI